MPRYTVHFKDRPHAANPTGEYRLRRTAHGPASAAKKVTREFRKAKIVRVELGWDD